MSQPGLVYCLLGKEALTEHYRLCRLYGLNSTQKNPNFILPAYKLQCRREFQKNLVEMMAKIIKPLLEMEIENDFIFILCGPDLVALDIYANVANLALVNQKGIVPGTVFSEQSCGVNGLVLAKKYQRIIGIRGEEHYCDFLKTLDCVSGPIKNAHGNVLGYINLARPLLRELASSFAIIRTIINAVETEIKFSSSGPLRLAFPAPLSLPRHIEAELTPREQEICWLLLQRLTNSEITAMLKLSMATVQTYRRNIYRKLDINGIRDLLALAACEKTNIID